ncbi:MAG: 50S ribosomal protein L3 N(5)-glutamine methyltransferase, partial [Pseudomonadota bacterium]
MTLQAVLEATAARLDDAGLFYGHGTDNPWDEAVALVLAVTQAPDDAAALERPVTAAALAQIEALVDRRIRERIPLAYLLGEWSYLGLPFYVAPEVLIPRSPMGHWLAAHGSQWLPRSPRRIVDLCTGSGCLGIVAALAFPEAELILTDLDLKALAVAGRNVRRHGLAERTTLLCLDGVQGLAPQRAFDLVLCNPPYVNERDMAALPAEYRAEPVHALAAGRDGLAVLQPILDALPGLLAPRGLFLGEVGHSAAALARAR